jgi:hypothetical protein
LQFEWKFKGVRIVSPKKTKEKWKIEKSTWLNRYMPTCSFSIKSDDLISGQAQESIACGMNIINVTLITNFAT